MCQARADKSTQERIAKIGAWYIVAQRDIPVKIHWVISLCFHPSLVVDMWYYYSVRMILLCSYVTCIVASHQLSASISGSCVVDDVF